MTTDFAAVVAYNTRIRALDISGNGIDAYAAAAFGEALSGNTTLTSLNLGGGHNSDGGGGGFSDVRGRGLNSVVGGVAGDGGGGSGDGGGVGGGGISVQRMRCEGCTALLRPLSTTTTTTTTTTTQATTAAVAAEAASPLSSSSSLRALDLSRHSLRNEASSAS
jgi:hypothetical protein